MMLRSTVRQYLASSASTISVAMTAVSFVWLEPLMLKLILPGSEIPMTTSDTSWLVASIEFGEVIATIPAGILADRYGRKPLLLSTGPLCLLGWVLVLTTRSLPVLYAVRQLQGMAIAIVYVAGPAYVAEISEARIRGELSGHFQTQWFAGILLVYIIGPLFDYQTYVYICCALPILFILTFAFVPESPYYFLMVGKHEKAVKALQWLRASDDVTEEFNSIRETVEREMKEKGGWKDLFATKHDTKMFLIVQLVCAVKYLNGMAVVVSYATESLKKGYDDPYLMIVGLGVVLCLTTTLSAFISDSVGRRSLLLWSVFGSIICNVILAVYYYLVDNTTIDMTEYSWIMLASMVGFFIAANIGLGPLLQTIQAEYFPSNTRSIGGGITEMTAAVVTFFSLKQFQMLTDAFGIYSNYAAFAGFSVLGYILFYYLIPETAGQTLGEIQENAKGVKPNGDIELAESGADPETTSNGKH